MRKILASALIILSVGVLAGCERQDIGTATGAVAGGVIGSAVSNGNPVATVGGASRGIIFRIKIKHHFFTT